MIYFSVDRKYLTDLIQLCMVQSCDGDTVILFTQEPRHYAVLFSI